MAVTPLLQSAAESGMEPLQPIQNRQGLRRPPRRAQVYGLTQQGVAIGRRADGLSRRYHRGAAASSGASQFGSGWSAS